MKVIRWLTNWRGCSTGSMWRAPGTTTARQSGRIGQPPGHLGRRTGILGAGDGERGHRDPAELGTDLGVRGREDAIGADEGGHVVGHQRGAGALDDGRSDVGAVVPPVQRPRRGGAEIGLGGFQPAQHRLAFGGRAPAHRAHRGEGAHELRSVAREVLGDQGAEEADQVRAVRHLADDPVGEVRQRDARTRRGTAPVAREVRGDHGEVGRQQVGDRRPHAVVESTPCRSTRVGLVIAPGSARWRGASRCCGRPGRRRRAR